MRQKEKTATKPGSSNKVRVHISFKIIVGIIAVLMVFSAVTILIGYWQFSERFTDEYSENAMHIARASASYLNPSHFDDYFEWAEKIDDNYEYQWSKVMIQNLCDKFGAEFIYVIRPDLTDYNHITFLFNIVNENSGFTEYPIGFVRETTNDDYRTKYKRLYDGVSEEEVVVRDKGYIESGSHITAMIAIKDDDGDVAGILCVQRQMDALTTARIKFSLRVILAMALIALATGFIYWFTLNRTLIRPIKRITKETARFAEQPSPAEAPLTQHIKSGDEIGVLAHSIDKLESETLNYIVNLTRVTAEQQRIGTELDLASKIQKSMLNAEFPVHEAFDIYASMTPAKEVGGDFYDFFMIDDDHLCLSIADVSGKGIPAALFMMVSKIVIADAAMNCSSPAEVLRTVNDRICKNNKLDMFITVWLAILELSTGKLVASNAGHEYPLIYRNGRRFDILHDKHGFVIGGMDGMKYTDYELTLGDGDAIFVYTDGLPEAADGKSQVFGMERVTEALNSAPFTSPKELLPTVQAHVDSFIGEAPQFDDLTMLCIKYKGKKQPPTDQKPL